MGFVMGFPLTYPNPGFVLFVTPANPGIRIFVNPAFPCFPVLHKPVNSGLATFVFFYEFRIRMNRIFTNPANLRILDSQNFKILRI